MKLNKKFYQQKTLKIAEDLLGKIIVRKINGKKIIGEIIETEAYVGPNDLASHASRGRTKRTEVMFAEGGCWYVYLIYGMYYCLNIVTENKDYPAAVLIRAIQPIKGISANAKTDGPGKVSRALRIDKSLNFTAAFGKESKLWIEDWGIKTPKNKIKKSPRIGVDYAKQYKNKPWRFYIKK